MPVVYDLFSRLVGVLLLWIAAVVVWNLTGSKQRSRGVGALVLRALLGSTLAFCAMFVLYATVPLTLRSAFSILAIVAFLTAFLVDALIGDEIRSVFLSRLR